MCTPFRVTVGSLPIELILAGLLTFAVRTVIVFGAVCAAFSGVSRGAVALLVVVPTCVERTSEACAALAARSL